MAKHAWSDGQRRQGSSAVGPLGMMAGSGGPLPHLEIAEGGPSGMIAHRLQDPLRGFPRYGVFSAKGVLQDEIQYPSVDSLSSNSNRT